MKPYEHGGNIEAFAQSINTPINEVVDLSSNINDLKPIINLDFNTLDISSYPSYDKLYEVIANNYGVSAENIELFNGGSSAIFNLFRDLGLTHCTIFSPAYLEYKKAATLFDYEIELINRFENPSYMLQKNSLVIFVNPSTPDGQYSNIKTLIEEAKKSNATLLIDESFLDFTLYESALKYLDSYDKLYILKSMTKFYSSAGIRVGALISNASNIKQLKSKQPQWKLSQFDSHYLQEALKDEALKEKPKMKSKQTENFLLKNLKVSLLSKKFSLAVRNYVLIQLERLTAHKLQEKLKSSKIMIRDCSNFDFLDESYIRIAVKSKETIQKLETALLKVEINEKY